MQKFKPDPLPYSDTQVTVDKSQNQIRTILVEQGADGIRWTDSYIPRRMATLEFVRSQRLFKLVVPIHTEDIERQRELIAPIKFKDYLEKRERAMFRAMYWYIKGLTDAEKHGLMSFEEAFVGHVASRLPSGETITVVEAVLKHGFDPARALPDTTGSLKRVN